jgi:curved DNA-binding protein CbpA
VLKCARDASVEEIERAWRIAAKTAHPDAGGSHEAMARLNAAREAALKERAP